MGKYTFAMILFWIQDIVIRAHKGQHWPRLHGGIRFLESGTCLLDPACLYIGTPALVREAIQNHRVDPRHLEFTAARPARLAVEVKEAMEQIAVMCGGRSAEELIFKQVTTGASNDIERATKLARNMVTQYGMSEKFGMMALGTVQSQYLDGGYSMNCAQETFAAADREVVELLQRCHDEAMELLRENREMLDAIASYLFEKETITGAQMMAILDGRDPEQEEYYGVPAAKDSAIEPPAKHISMVSEAIPMPEPAGEDGGEETEQADSPEENDIKAE